MMWLKEEKDFGSQPVGIINYPVVAPQRAPLPMDPQNVVESLGPDQFHLVVGEGTYNIGKSIYLAMPPIQPPESPVFPPNPIDTAKKPPTVGTKLSLAVVGPKSSFNLPHHHQLKQQEVVLTPRSTTPEDDDDDDEEEVEEEKKEEEEEEEEEERLEICVNEEDLEEDDTAVGRTSDSLRGDEGSVSDHLESFDTPIFGNHNPALTHNPTSKETRLAATLKMRKPKNSMTKTNSSFVSRVSAIDNLGKKLIERDPDGLYAFANIGRCFHWLDISAMQESKADSLTKMVFSKANALCHDTNQFTSTSPAHIDLIMGFSTGDLLWYEPISQKYTRLNKNGVINPSPIFDVKWLPGSKNLFLTGHEDGTLVVFDKEKEDIAFDEEEDAAEDLLFDPEKPSLYVLKSVQSPSQKTNPLAYWKVCNARINGLAFSPDGMTLAIVSEEGRLRLADFHNEVLTDCFNSFFGPLYCVCWSPDGKYILTGGQDDLVSIYSFYDKRLIARFRGHRNWVRAVAFDPWRCDERNYRFGAVGDDRRLCLWDFNIGMIHQPRSSQSNGQVTALSKGNGEDESETEEGIAVVHRTVTTVMKPFQPLISEIVDDHQLSWIGFQEDSIVTSCQRGHIRVWNRPEEKSSEDDIEI